MSQSELPPCLVPAAGGGGPVRGGGRVPAGHPLPARDRRHLQDRPPGARPCFQLLYGVSRVHTEYWESGAGARGEDANESDTITQVAISWRWMQGRAYKCYLARTNI